jgi:hypothetical protein
LEVLRDLIFGNQARDFSRRITDLDSRLEVVRRELKSEQDSRAQSVAKTAADQTTALRKETYSRLDKEVQIIGERIDELSTQLKSQMESMQRAIESRLDRMQADSAERLRLLEEDARQRDDDLRAELLTVTAWLDDKKTSRETMGRMLEEMGQRLQAAGQPGTGLPGNGQPVKPEPSGNE